jgi:NAD(P)H-flavin reductase
MESSQIHSLVITRVRPQGHDTRSFDMVLANAQEDRHARSIKFTPGQVAVLRPAGEKNAAYFAFASAPEDDEIAFLIKRARGASDTLYEMTEGAPVELLDIVGAGFPLDDYKGRDLVFIAMGTGVAPLRSALRHVLRRKKDFGQLVVLYGGRTPDDFCYRDETQHWQSAGVELRQVISRPDGHDWSGPTGYVQSLLDHVLPELKTPVALVCGSSTMIEQTRARLRQMGFAPEAILTNY